MRVGVNTTFFIKIVTGWISLPPPKLECEKMSFLLFQHWNWHPEEDRAKENREAVLTQTKPDYNS